MAKWEGYAANQKRVLNLMQRGVKERGVSDSLGPGGSLVENLIADLQEAGYTIWRGDEEVF